MTIERLYREGRERLVALATDLDARSAATPVPACPGWTVRGVYAHLSGVVADALAGRMEGVTTDAWTQRQVDARADWPLDRIIEEWTGNAQAFDAGLAPAPRRR